MRLRRGETLKVGRTATRVFLIESGLCATYVGGEIQHDSVLALFGPGSVMGGVKAVSEERVDLKGKVLRDLEALSLAPEAYRAAMARDLEMAVLIARTIVRQQESQYEGLVTNISLAPADRLKVLLRTLIVTQTGEVKPDWNVVPFSLNNEEYAAILHTTRVTVSRVLSGWIAAGVLRKQRREIEVTGEFLADVFDWMEAAA